MNRSRMTMLISAILFAALAQAEVLRPANLGALPPPPIPPDNPQTAAKIELGKLLFFDSRISGDGSMSCVSCHLPELGWSFRDTVSMGYPGTIHWRNSQTIVNSAYYKELFWEGAVSSLEKQAPAAQKGAVAGNGESDQMEARLAFIPDYRERFKAVFGDEWPLLTNAWMAIAAFERTLVQRDTPFDLYMLGDDTALTTEQQAGLQLFVGKAGCAQCHNGALFSDEKYYNLGVPPADIWEEDGMAQVTFRYELYAKGVSEALYRHSKDDLGLYFRTKQHADQGKFRTPSLRYTKYTAPYMHNGAFFTLDEVIEFYDQGGGKNEFAHSKTPLLRPLGLSRAERAQLKAFILSLSGPPILIDEPELPETQPLLKLNHQGELERIDE